MSTSGDLFIPLIVLGRIYVGVMDCKYFNVKVYRRLLLGLGEGALD
jgi:hypothetical protein